MSRPAPAFVAPPAGQAPVGQLVAIITAQLPSATRRGIGLAALRDRYQGRFHHLALDSVFQPLVATADGRTVGHEGLVRCGGDGALSPWPLFSLAAHNADPAWLVALDRLCRTLHAANYFSAVTSEQRLFVSLQEGLVSAVAANHGQVYAGILRLMQVPPRRVVIQLPASLNRDTARLRAVGESFSARGFGLALDYGGEPREWLGALGFSQPAYLRIDPARLRDDASLAWLVRACRREGLTTIVKYVETPARRALALHAGADLIQGHAIGRPQAVPVAGLR